VNLSDTKRNEAKAKLSHRAIYLRTV